MTPRPSSEDIQSAFIAAVRLHQSGRNAEAAVAYDKILLMVPSHAGALRLRGVCDFQQGRIADGLPFVERAVALEPQDAHARIDLAKALTALRRHDEALPHYQAAVALKPHQADLHESTGDCLLALQRHVDAAESYEAALALTPAAALHLKAGIALQSAELSERAIGHYRHALAAVPDDAETRHNLAFALASLERHAEAAEQYGAAIALKPDNARFHGNLALTLKGLGRHEEAVAAFAKALALKPDLDFLFGSWLHAKMMVCDWNDLDAAFARLAEGIERGERISSPFGVVATPLSGELQLRCAEIYTRTLHPPKTSAPIARRPGDGRIRLGYFSGDLHDHPVGYLIAEMIERHNRERFEVYAFSFGPERAEPIRDRLRAGFDRFIDIRGISDAEAAALSHAEGIDIAIDLMGYTGACRMDIFAHRAAPLQVNYLGYPGTLGASYIDYIFADPILIPKDQQPLYSEKIAYLPHSYQPNDSQRPISQKTFTRADFGLPDQGFVFSCFNKNYKITPDVYDIWMRLLRRIDGSVLWLFEDTAAVARNLRREAAARDVDPDRLVFAHKMHSLADYLARAKNADLFLDTLHYNAHTTASDALWAGLPVLTCPGRSFGSRVAAGLLSAVGLPMLIAADLADYERKALALAADPERVADLKRMLKKNVQSCPLFDTKLYTRHIDAAYEAMWRRHSAGLPPEHFSIKSYI